MPANFLHGTETIDVPIGPVKVTVVKSGVIGLVGISPKGDAQKNILVTNPNDAAQFGKPLPGFTIPQALAAILAQGTGAVVVVNVFDATTNTVAVTNETRVVDSNGRGKLDFAPLSNIVAKDSTLATTYVIDVDYKIDEFGKIQVLDFTSIAPGATIKVSYKRLDPDSVTSSQIIGAVDGGTNVRTGTKLFDLVRQLFGFKPKLFITPGYSDINEVAAELTILANKFKGHCYIDAPVGTTVPDAISGRGPLGEINFNTSDVRTELLHPMLKAFDQAGNADIVVPYSAYAAGVRAAVDNDEGFWVSSSNHQILGISGTEIPISAEINDATTEANALNENGITTVFNSFGTGLRVWGNRNASFPVNSGPETFVAIRRAADVIHESIEYGMLPYIDQPLTKALLDVVKESVNGFIRALIGRGALIPGSKCVLLPEDNPPEELAAGHATWFIDIMGPTPLERATFKSFIDIKLLKNIV